MIITLLNKQSKELMISQIKGRVAEIDTVAIQSSVALNPEKESAQTQQETSFKASQRRLRTDTLSQPNLNDIQSMQNVNYAASQMFVIGISDPHISPEALDALIKYSNNPYGIPAIHYAIMQGDEESVRLFLDHGASPNSKSPITIHKINPDGFGATTALDFAAEYGRLNIAKLLLERGAAVKHKAFPAEFKDDSEVCSIIFAAQINHSEIIKLFVENGAEILSNSDRPYLDPTYCAIRSGSVAALKVLLDLGGKLDSQFSIRGELLSTAVISGNIEMVRFLLDRNVPVESPTHYASALNDAIWQQDIEIINLLISRGAKIYRPDLPGYGPIDYACKTDNSIIIKLILNAAPIDYDCLYIPMRNSILDKHNNAVRTLIKAGTNVNDRKRDEKTLFMVAVQCANFEAMEIYPSKFKSWSRELQSP